MKLLMTMFFLTVGLSAMAQTKKIKIPVIRNKDTTLWFNWSQSDRLKLKLPDLTTGLDSMHFRVWRSNQIVDIWTNDFNIFKGTITNFSSRTPNTIRSESRKPKPIKYVQQQLIIDTANARKVYKLFFDNSIFKIPSEDEIKGWAIVDDGETYLIEYSTPSFYSFQSYGNPSYSTNIKEGKLVNETMNELINLLRLGKVQNDFYNGLPHGCYGKGGVIMCIECH